MAFYNEKEQLYLKIGAEGVRLGKILLYTSKGMWFQRNEVPYNAALQPITFTSKGPANTES